MDITGFDRAIFTGPGIAFIEAVEQQMTRTPERTRLTFPPEIGEIERAAVVDRLKIVSGYIVTRKDDDVIVVRKTRFDVIYDHGTYLAGIPGGTEDQVAHLRTVVTRLIAGGQFTAAAYNVGAAGYFAFTLGTFALELTVGPGADDVGVTCHLIGEFLTEEFAKEEN